MKTILFMSQAWWSLSFIKQKKKTLLILTAYILPRCPSAEDTTCFKNFSCHTSLLLVVSIYPPLPLRHNNPWLCPVTISATGFNFSFCFRKSKQWANKPISPVCPTRRWEESQTYLCLLQSTHSFLPWARPSALRAVPRGTEVLPSLYAVAAMRWQQALFPVRPGREWRGLLGVSPGRKGGTCDSKCCKKSFPPASASLCAVFDKARWLRCSCAPGHPDEATTSLTQLNFLSCCWGKNSSVVGWR